LLQQLNQAVESMAPVTVTYIDLKGQLRKEHLGDHLLTGKSADGHKTYYDKNWEKQYFAKCSPESQCNFLVKNYPVDPPEAAFRGIIQSVQVEK